MKTRMIEISEPLPSKKNSYVVRYSPQFWRAIGPIVAEFSKLGIQTVCLPVLGIPAAGGVADGLDALLSTVQMPGGVPVATFAVGKAGGMNAAVFACQVLGLSDPAVAKKLQGFRAAQRAKVEKDDDEVRKARA